MTRRLVATDYGSPAQVLSVIDADDPVAGDGHVVVAVAAAGLNPFDVKRVQGVMSTDPNALPLAIGGEAAGTVAQAGPGTDLVVGDRVAVYPVSGAFAEQIVVDAAAAHPIPDGASTEAAAGLLLAGVTAYDTVATLDIGADDVVLVHGGSGAVGSIAVVLAAARGATVIATASQANHDHLRDLGAVPVAYDGDLAAAVADASPGAITAVIDTVGTDVAIDVSLQSVSPDRIVSIAAWGRGDDGIVLLNGSSESSRANRRAAVAPLLDALADGQITVDIAGTFSFDDAAQAFDALDGRHPRGKYILTP
ncbi:NADP-dependent oxidoreductase [Gordonia sp. HY002]|uniref:quinone oxidoreductase family protein n=1 Tax=Gordonia zhenghanii TaxID=2911516 RepID=UPI001EF0B2F0|nr:NADP-dependent oxidoreductase [Gordonia zhenghanii]MCF8571162.1 NADP-dependent oxidoreductase [Gordonia zhenghanii]MCF8607180.1 NADP-dependent oxidoreductase [Gordonia zhenghanii]